MRANFQGKRRMIRITMQYIWSLAEGLEPLERLDVTKPADRFELFLEIAGPQWHLQQLLQSSVFSENLRICVLLGENLLAALRSISDSDWKVEQQPVQQFAIMNIKNSYSQFKIAFLAELNTLPTYFVTQKGSHDTHTLLERSDKAFPDDLSKKVKEAMFDVAEAGKAICYELPTAAGYHLFRATEAVLRRYYSHVTGGMPQPKMRNIGVYIRAMRKAQCGDERILSVLDQLAKLHRNPLIHPEVTLTMDEAMSLMGMARSAVTAMLSVLPEVPQTTTGADQSSA